MKISKFYNSWHITNIFGNLLHELFQLLIAELFLQQFLYLAGENKHSSNGRLIGICILFSYIYICIYKLYKYIYPFGSQLMRRVYYAFDQNLDFRIRKDHQKKLLWAHPVYESEDVRSLFSVVSRKSTECSTHDSKRYLLYVHIFVYLFCMWLWHDIIRLTFKI